MRHHELRGTYPTLEVKRCPTASCGGWARFEKVAQYPDGRYRWFKCPKCGCAVGVRDS